MGPTQVESQEGGHHSIRARLDKVTPAPEPSSQSIRTPAPIKLQSMTNVPEEAVRQININDLLELCKYKERRKRTLEQS